MVHLQENIADLTEELSERNETLSQIEVCHVHKQCTCM